MQNPGPALRLNIARILVPTSYSFHWEWSWRRRVKQHEIPTATQTKRCQFVNLHQTLQNLFDAGTLRQKLVWHQFCVKLSHLRTFYASEIFHSHCSPNSFVPETSLYLFVFYTSAITLEYNICNGCGYTVLLWLFQLLVTSIHIVIDWIEVMELELEEKSLVSVQFQFDKLLIQIIQMGNVNIVMSMKL